jgi:hypothetical protein
MEFSDIGTPTALFPACRRMWDRLGDRLLQRFLEILFSLAWPPARTIGPNYREGDNTRNYADD